MAGFQINIADYIEVITYPTTIDLINALRNHTVDGTVEDKSTNDYILFHNYDINKIPEKIGIVQYGPIFQKDGIYKELYEQFASKTKIPYINEKWNNINYDSQKVETSLNGSNGL